MPKNREKIGFSMPTAKKRFYILVLHLKKHIIEEKNTLYLYFYWTFTLFLILNFLDVSKFREVIKVPERS